jgi:hypothetical protein
LLEILRVRHCSFILGQAGSGKTVIWQLLAHALQNDGGCQYERINPKALELE